MSQIAAENPAVPYPLGLVGTSLSAKEIADNYQHGVLLFTDIVGSTEMKSRLGTVAYWLLLRRHNDLFEQICKQAGCPELKHTGDGYFAIFDVPSKAVQLALLFQDALRRQAWDPPLCVRTGIASGQVIKVKMAGRDDVIGLAADLAARVMSLAGGGQILMTREVYFDARQYVKDHPVLDGDQQNKPQLEWKVHGLYRVKGQEEPLEVFEVGAKGLAPLTAPTTGVALSSEQEAHHRWRPSVGAKIPTQGGWELERKLGEGGFGEVWLARNEPLQRHQVFKFCFDAERLRSFRRELMLFNTIRDKLGDRNDIARLTGVQLDQPPYLLVSQYAAGGNLAEWAQQQGGLNSIRLKERLEIVAQVADAVAAAHSVGVLHKDIKPANILIEKLPDGQIRPLISDFGIGFLNTEAQLERLGQTRKQLAQTLLHDSTGSGAQMYAPPEVLANQPFTIKGDVYALGVLLYQMVAGDLNRPLAPGWERDTSDELLRELIGQCVDGHLDRRLSSAAGVVRRLRDLDQERERRRRAMRVRTLLRSSAVGTGALIALVLLLALWIVRERKYNRELDAQKAEAKQQAETAEQVLQFQKDILSAADPDKSSGEVLTVLQLMNIAAEGLNAGAFRTPRVDAAIRGAVGDTFRRLGKTELAEPLLVKALEMQQHIRPQSLEIAESLDNLAQLRHDQALEFQKAKRTDDAKVRFDEAESLYQQAVTIRQKLLSAGDPLINSTRNTLGQLYQDQGRLDDAFSLLKAALDEASGTDNHQNIAACAHALAAVLEKQGKLSEAESRYREALSQCMEAFPPPEGHWRIGQCQMCLAYCLECEGDEQATGNEHKSALDTWQKAANEYKNALETWKKAAPADRKLIDVSTKHLAALNERLGGRSITSAPTEAAQVGEPTTQR